MNVKFEDIMRDVEKETRESMTAAQRDILLQKLRKLRGGDLDEAVVQHVKSVGPEELRALSMALDSEIWQVIQQQQERQHNPPEDPPSVGSAKHDTSGPEASNGSGKGPVNGGSHS